MNYREIITLGKHRLMCGDATSREDVMRLVDGETVDLVLTDPPYGIKIQHSDGHIGGNAPMSWTRKDGRKYSATTAPKFINDDSTDTARKHWDIVGSFDCGHIIWGVQYFTDFLPVSGGRIFWDKDRPSELDFGAGELAWTDCIRVIRKYRQKHNGCIREGNRELNKRVHPTQKPVELHAKILEDFTKPGDVILDCFGGSGTTLIACEITGRKCLMMEISPEYCGIIRDRFNSLHNTTPLFSKEVSSCQQ